MEKREEKITVGIVLDSSRFLSKRPKYVLGPLLGSWKINYIILFFSLFLYNLKVLNHFQFSLLPFVSSIHYKEKGRVSGTGEGREQIHDPVTKQQRLVNEGLKEI